MATAGSLEALRELNRLRVIDALRQRGTASRSEIARHTGLSRTTVTTLVSDLQARGLVVEQPFGESQGRGRPPTLLRLDPSVGAVVGMHFDHRHVRVAVADLSSTVLAERWEELDVDHAATTALDSAAALVAVALEEAGIERSRVVGAGVALSGPVDRDGTVGSTVILPGWEGLNAIDELTRRLELPVSVDNDANLGALAEVSFGAGRGMSDVIYVMVASGVGAGIVLDGRLHRGVTGLAGELGHVRVRAEGAVCRCGNRGCLETVASTDAMLSLLRPVESGETNIGALVEMVAAGDIGAQRVVNDAGREIGRVVAGLCNVLSPSGVIVGGDLGIVADSLMNGIREALDRYALPPVRAALELRAGVLGERAEMLGALALVIGDTDLLRSAGLAALHTEAGATVAA
ncbi:MAG TPA: ROK family transcriptional regulator [Gaiellaceae bacterium]|jgi:predicted NBD/HSP70 family sugar kinase/biotin operon repressor|nr:ROK family transcriptional regulator [Gaiellaceae bacterium]